MAERDRPHILIQGGAAVEAYRRPGRDIGEGKPLPSPANRPAHATVLRTQLETANSTALARRDEAALVPDAVRGIYVTFRSAPDIHLAFESLDPRRGCVHPEL